MVKISSAKLTLKSIQKMGAIPEKIGY